MIQKCLYIYIELVASQIRPMRNLILSRTANSARRTQILQTTLPRSSTLNEYQELRICVSKKGASIVFENSAVWSNWLPSFIITHNSKEISLKVQHLPKRNCKAPEKKAVMIAKCSKIAGFSKLRSVPQSQFGSLCKLTTKYDYVIGFMGQPF